MFLVVTVNFYELEKAKYGARHSIPNSHIFSGVDKFIGNVKNRGKYTTFFKGDIWSFSIGKLNLTDPLAVLINLVQRKKIFYPLVLSALIPLLLTLFLGKFFCSWICPAGLLFEFNDMFRKYLEKKGVKFSKFSLDSSAKYWLLGVGLSIALITGVSGLHVIYPPRLVCNAMYNIVTRSALGAGSFLILLILVFELFISSRIWCNSLCPGGALYSILGKWRFLKVKNNLSKCTHCSHCHSVCPYNLHPFKNISDLECDNCSICIKKCPEKSLSFTLSTKKNLAKLSIFSLLFFFTFNSQAHHIRGLPHYGYSKNYQQSPTFTEVRISGDYEIQFSFIRIFETKNVSLAIYVKNLKTTKPFLAKVRFKVYASWENPDEQTFFDANADVTNTYRTVWVYEKDGVYNLAISFTDDMNNKHYEEFLMQMGNPKVNKYIFIIPFLVILLLIVMIKFKSKEENEVENI